MIDKNTVIKKINSHAEWFPKSYAGFFLGIDMQGMGLSLGSKLLPTAQRYGLVYQNRLQKDHWEWFWDWREMLAKRKEILRKASANGLFATSFYAAWRRRYRRYVAYYEEIERGRMEKFSDKKTLASYKKLHALCLDQAAYGYVVDAFLSTGEDDWLAAIIQRQLGKKAAAEDVRALAAPVFSSFVNDYELSLVHLALLLRQKKQVQAKAKAKEIEKKFFWIKTNYLDFARLTQAHILREARELGTDSAKLEQLRRAKSETAEKNRLAKQKIFSRTGASKTLRRIIRIAELFSEIQDRRKECVLRHNTLLYELAQRLAKKHRLNHRLLFYTTQQELLSLLDGTQPDWKAVQDRYDRGVLKLYYSGTSSLLNADEIRARINEAHLYPKLENVKSLKGSPAHPGIAKGTVRILRNTTDITAFPEGCILVANQTTPEFVTAMKRAAAVLTDQGGITSHAAIVSRELGIPCVVGIKNATRLLHDGDRVEVDAGKGTVTIL